MSPEEVKELRRAKQEALKESRDRAQARKERMIKVTKCASAQRNTQTDFPILLYPVVFTISVKELMVLVQMEEERKKHVVKTETEALQQEEDKGAACLSCSFFPLPLEVLPALLNALLLCEQPLSPVPSTCLKRSWMM